MELHVTRELVESSHLSQYPNSTEKTQASIYRDDAIVTFNDPDCKIVENLQKFYLAIKT